ncbi:MAG: hypothetical protein KatS3mg105_2304 [Gemmatales bacterium]|nr:MAG: hypothetical protein KatS3mg105_2304 [Gemmatales bacterium]
MRLPNLAAVTASLAGLLLVAGTYGDLAQDKKILSTAKLPTDSAGLLRYLQQQAAKKKLNDLSALQAAVRVLAAEDVENATPTFIELLAATNDAGLREELHAALSVVAFKDEKPHPALQQGLTHASESVRSACASLLGERLPIKQLGPVKKLYQDKSPRVRLDAGRTLLRRGQADAVFVLIDLFDGPGEVASEALDALTSYIGRQAPDVELGDNANARKRCQQVWRDWWTDLDDEKLLDRFRESILTDHRRKQILALINELGSDDFFAREKATSELMEIGAAAVPLLMQATNHADPEIVFRCNKCLEKMEKSGLKNPAESSRLVALRQPEGAVEVLLAYLPFVQDETSREEVQDALNMLAAADEEKFLDPLHAALKDELDVRRFAAAIALAYSPKWRSSPELRTFFRDKDPRVRLRVASALVQNRQRDAIPVLIDMIGILPETDTWSAEQLLMQLAGDDAPEPPGSSDRKARQRYRDAWTAWWKRNDEKVNLARINAANRLLGYTLVVLANNRLVQEIDRNGKTLWQLPVNYPLDAEVLPGGRILVAEYATSMVTERDRKNKILWQHRISYPISCQRLPNGNTFIASRMQLTEVTRAGKTVFDIQRRNRDIMGAVKLRDGTILCVNRQRQLITYNQAGKILKTIALPGQVYSYIHFDRLANGNTVVPLPSNSKVVEIDSNGKTVWECRIQNPTSAKRLPNGRTLIAQLSGKVVEVDRNGKVVWEQQIPGSVYRASRR